MTVPESPEHICTQYFDRFDPVQPWSLLKLGALRYLASIYLPIMEGQLREQNYKAVYYIDFFSGCGVNKIEGSSVRCYGSPLIINQVQKENDKRFTKMFFNDIDSEKASALKSCLNRIKETRCEVTSKDANERVQEIKHELSRNSHSLIFVDPYFMAFSRNSMETILKMSADIFFFYPTATVQMTLPKEDVDQQTQDFFKDYEIAKATYKDKNISASRKPLAVFNVYKRDVEDVRGPENTRTERIRINGGSYYYDMLFISRRTTRDNPWWNGVESLKNGLKGCDGDTVVRILRSDQSNLAAW